MGRQQAFGHTPEPFEEIPRVVEEHKQKVQKQARRKSSKQAKAPSRPRKRPRRAYDTTEETITAIEEIAAELGLELWQTHEYLIQEAIRLHKAGEIAPELRPVRYGIIE